MPSNGDWPDVDVPVRNPGEADKDEREDSVALSGGDAPSGDGFGGELLDPRFAGASRGTVFEAGARTCRGGGGSDPRAFLTGDFWVGGNGVPAGRFCGRGGALSISPSELTLERALAADAGFFDAGLGAWAGCIGEGALDAGRWTG